MLALRGFRELERVAVPRAVGDVPFAWLWVTDTGAARSRRAVFGGPELGTICNWRGFIFSPPAAFSCSRTGSLGELMSKYCVLPSFIRLRGCTFASEATWRGRKAAGSWIPVTGSSAAPCRASLDLSTASSCPRFSASSRQRPASARAACSCSCKMDRSPPSAAFCFASSKRTL